MQTRDSSGPEADDLDRAAQLSYKINEAYIESVRQRNKPEQTKDADGTWPHPDCVECDEPLPPLRLQMGRLRCVFCQTRLERERRK